MPKIRLEPVSKSRRPIGDRIRTFLLESTQGGILRDDRDVSMTSRRLTVDAAPADYTVQMEIEGFRDFTGKFKIKANSGPSVPLELTHRAKAMPALQDLSAAQRNLLSTTGSTAAAAWASLSDNQAGTFFQISHALESCRLHNGRDLASYIETVRVIGGSEIQDDIPDGKVRTETGWRMHVTIQPGDRKAIENDITKNGTFGPRDGSSHPTHSRFGLVYSYRERGVLPRLQVVFDESFRHADVDLDVELHRSAPHDVFRHFKTKFPAATENFSF